MYVTVPFGFSGALELEVKLNPAPDTVAPEMFTTAEPSSVTTTGIVVDVPVTTLPKLSVVELGESCEVATTPMPVSMMFMDESDASLAIVNVP